MSAAETGTDELPRAKVQFRQDGPAKKSCDVIVNGKVVAYLPICNFEYAADMLSVPRVKLTLHAGDAEITTFDPADVRSRS